MARPLTQSDLIFSTQSLNFSSTLSSLKRSALSITNRLSSITSDSSFVISVSEAYNLPLVANERCGSWYIPPQKKTGSAYFKSTDGHMNEWSFNLRRLNLQVLDLVASRGGCVIVDSTRRGKSMPDALSKTIPIWCCVMNRAILFDSGPHELHTPPNAISASEHAQIERRIDGFVRQFLDICKPSIPQLRQKLQKPLRPLWVTQASTLPDTPPSFTDFHPIVLCTASRRVHGNEGSENGYIQGAADDHEAWAGGLTPQLFWNHHSKLLGTNEEDIPSVITTLVQEEKGTDAVPILINPTTNVYISSSENIDISSFDAIISCTPEPLTTSNHEDVKTKKYLHLSIAAGKLGSRDLRTQLARLNQFIESLPHPETTKILICDPTGKDAAVGVALAVLCLYADDKGQLSKMSEKKKMDKRYIKQRLTWITTTSPILNPSRETLKSVNAFLMPDPMSSKDTTSTTEYPPSKLILVDVNNIPIPEQTIDDAQVTAPSKAPSNEPPQTQSIPTTLFTRLQTPTNTWSFTRTLKSALPSHPSGTVTGTATFTPYIPTSSSPDTTPTLLYAEEGSFTTTTGLNFTTRRKYIYQLTDAPSSSSSTPPTGDDNQEYISVHFFDDNTTADAPAAAGLFVEMGMLEERAWGWETRNREQHLCGGDLYTASWKFGKGMVGEGSDEDVWWEVRYDVKGPKKDYVSETRYTLV